MDIQKIGLRETLEALPRELSEAILLSEGKEIRVLPNLSCKFKKEKGKNIA